MGLCLEKLSPQQRLDYFAFGFVFEEPGDDGLGLAAVLVAFPLAGVDRAVLLLFLAATVLVADFLTAFFAATFFAEAFFAATFLAACFCALPRLAWSRRPSVLPDRVWSQSCAAAQCDRSPASLPKRYERQSRRSRGESILLDYVDFVVHIFSEEKRDFYHIERLRKTATTLDLEELKASLTKRVSAVRKKQAARKVAAKKASAKKVAAKKAVKKSATKTVAAKNNSKTARATPARGKATKTAAKPRPSSPGSSKTKPKAK